MREWMKEYTDQLPEYNYLLDELLDDVSDEAGASLSQSFGMDKADIFFGRTLKLTLGWKIRSHRSENGKKIMGEDPQSLENHGFPQISQLVLHSTSPRTAYRSRRLFYKSRRSRILLRLLSKPDPLPLKLRFDFLLWTPQVLYRHSHHRTRRKRPCRLRRVFPIAFV